VRAEIVRITTSPFLRVAARKCVGVEALAVDGTFDEARRFDPVVAQRGEEGCGFSMGNLIDAPLSFGRPAAKAGHVGLGPGLVDEDQAGGVDQALIGPPAPPPRLSSVFGNTVRQIKLKLPHIIEVSALMPRSAKKPVTKALHRDVPFLASSSSPTLARIIFCFLVIVGVLSNAEAGRWEPRPLRAGLGFRLSYNTNCQIKS
jgi:hypothetical protein